MTEDPLELSVVFPGSGARTTTLGVGLATIMREPSAAGQQRLLHFAHESGYRHFDVAPSYGLGEAESVLGRFLRTRPAGVTVATKVGIEAKANRAMRLVQRPARALLRRFPNLRGRTTAAVGSAIHSAPDFSLGHCSRSLERSLRSLGVEYLDVLLLHEARSEDLTNGGILEWLERQKARGLVRNIGIATTAQQASAISKDLLERLDVLQIPSHVLAPARLTVGSADLLLITHGAIASPLGTVEQRFASDPGWRRQLAECAGVELRARDDRARLLLACAVAENPQGIVLIGTSSSEHLRSAASAMGAYSAAQLSAVTRFLRDSISETITL